MTKNKKKEKKKWYGKLYKKEDLPKNSFWEAFLTQIIFLRDSQNNIIGVSTFVTDNILKDVDPKENDWLYVDKEGYVTLHLYKSTINQ